MVGYRQDHPDYWEEAESFDTLHSNLSSLNFDLTVLNALKGRKEPDQSSDDGQPLASAIDGQADLLVMEIKTC